MPYNPEWLKDQVCRFCGDTFKTRSRRRHYCSDKCWLRAHAPKPPKSPPWTQEEIKVLRQLARKVPAHVIAERLGTRTCKAVKGKARRLNISLMRYGEHWPSAKYSDAVVERARTLHEAGLTPTAIATQLGIPLKAIGNYVYYQCRLGPPIEYYF